jgi:Rrf2 family protein
VLKINKKVEYAMMVLKFLARKQENDLVTVRDVCETFSTPFDSTAKVMQKLNSADILNSVKGIKGGYSLNIKLGDLSYMELVKIIEGEQIGRICESTKGKCENFDFCNIISPVENLNHQVYNFLDALNLEELLLSSSTNEQRQ